MFISGFDYTALTCGSLFFFISYNLEIDFKYSIKRTSIMVRGEAECLNTRFPGILSIKSSHRGLPWVVNHCDYKRGGSRFYVKGIIYYIYLFNYFNFSVFVW